MSSVPLVRYHIADKGGVLGFDEMRNFLREHGVQSLSGLGVARIFSAQPAVCLCVWAG